jgi:hypothetical protein
VPLGELVQGLVEASCRDDTPACGRDGALIARIRRLSTGPHRRCRLALLSDRTADFSSARFISVRRSVPQRRFQRGLGG